MTASAIQGDKEKCLDVGMNDYLAKPVRSTTLKKKLERYLYTDGSEPEVNGDGASDEKPPIITASNVRQLEAPSQTDGTAEREDKESKVVESPLVNGEVKQTELETIREVQESPKGTKRLE